MAKSTNRANTKSAALLAMMSGTTVCLRGETGVGKTHMMRQIAKETNRELIVLDAAIQSTEDLIGYPYRENDVMKWAKPDWFPSKIEGKKYLMFIDELNRASREVINSLMPLLLEGTMHTHRLPEDTWVACAINPDTIGYDATSGIEDRAVWARMCIINVDPDPDDWEEWLVNNSIKNEKNNKLVAEFKNQLLTGKVHEIVQYPNNRSFTKVLNVMNIANSLKGTEYEFSSDAVEKVCMGILGTGLFGSMQALLKISYGDITLPPIKELLKDINDKNIVYKTSWLVRHIKTDDDLTLDNVMAIYKMMEKYKIQYADQIEELKAAFRVAMIKDKYSKIFENKEIIRIQNDLNL